METFNVIRYDFNSKKFIPYDVIPYFVNSYKELVENHKKYPKSKYYKVPKGFKQFKEFVRKEALYQFWSRCEYEIILSDWPPSNPPIEEKWDVYDQIMMNLDVITKLVIKSI